MITPAAFRHTEDAFLDFLRGKGIKCGRRAEMEDGLRDALVGSASLDRYIPDLWAVFSTLTYIDVKSETARNAKTGNGTIEMRPLLRSQLHPSPPTIFVHYPDWGWADPDQLVAAKIWACCDPCFDELSFRQVPPEKCPDYRGPGSGDPHIVYRLSTYLPIDSLIQGHLQASSQAKDGHPPLAGSSSPALSASGKREAVPQPSPALSEAK